MIRKLRIILEMIKFEHTIFALPFAMISMLVAANGLPKWDTFVWIIVAMVGARSAAMTFNRIADAKIDESNPRTASRAIPKGLVSIKAAWAFVITSVGVFVVAAYMINTLAFALCPIALVVLLSYSYSKRFTSLSHLWLGLSLGIAPVGAWIAVTGQFDAAPILLSAAVMLWTAGFDIIYSLQDLEHDRNSALFSLPARLGALQALTISRLFHAGMVVLLIGFGLLANLGKIYYIGAALVAVFLIYEQSMVSKKDYSRVNTAFFTLNGCVSVGLLVFAAMDIFL